MSRNMREYLKMESEYRLDQTKDEWVIIDNLPVGDDGLLTWSITPWISDIECLHDVLPSRRCKEDSLAHFFVYNSVNYITCVFGMIKAALDGNEYADITFLNHTGSGPPLNLSNVSSPARTGQYTD